MAGRVTCNTCGARVDVPAGHARAKVRCPTCGYYTDAPPDLRGGEPDGDDAPPPPARRAAAPPPPEPAAEPLRPGVARPVRKAAPVPAAAPPPPDDTGPGPPALE